MTLRAAILTVGGLGYSPQSPGSLGALPAIILAWALHSQHALPAWLAWCLACVGGTALGVVLCHGYLKDAAHRRQHRRTKEAHDPQEIVLDEFVGCLISLAFVPWSLPWVIIAYLLFRGFDMFKPGPIGWIDKNLPGGWGIMLDDVAAGITAGALLYPLVQLSL